MHRYTQGLLALGTIAILAALAIPNLKAFALGPMNLIRTPEKRATVDRSRYRAYFAWVICLSVLSGLYSLAVTRNLKLFSEATDTDTFFLAVGLVAIILYKKDRPRNH